MGAPTGKLSIGVIGLGGMGAALATALLGAGYPVCCHDRRPEALAGLTGAGAEPVGSPRELAERSAVVCTFLPGPEQVREVALAVLPGLAPGAMLVDLSTCGVDTAAVLGEAFDAAGRVFVDCPVSRKPPDSTLLVGGQPGALGPAEQALRQVSREIIHCGRRGAGYATKLLNQHVKYAWYLASAEALLIAERHGLDADRTATAIGRCSGGESGLAAAAEYFRHDAEAMRTHAPAATIEKDVLLAGALAQAAGVSSPTLATLAQFFTEVGATRYRDLPYPRSNELLVQLRTEPPV